jgi:hypothetical protein
VTIVIANMNVGKHFGDLLRFQVVDYRTRDARVLQEMAQAFANPGTRVYGESVLPQSFNARVYPPLDDRIKQLGGLPALMRGFVITIVITGLLIGVLLPSRGSSTQSIQALANMQATQQTVATSPWAAGELRGQMRTAWQLTLFSISGTPFQYSSSPSQVKTAGQIIWNPGPIVLSKRGIIKLELTQITDGDPHTLVQQALAVKPVTIDALSDKLLTVTEYSDTDGSLQQVLYVVEGGTNAYVLYASQDGSTGSLDTGFLEALRAWARSLTLAVP